MRIFLTIIFLVVCVALTAIVLMQEGKAAGLGSIGGLGDTYWGKNKSKSMEGTLVKITKILAAAFLLIALGLNMMPDTKTVTLDESDFELVTESELIGENAAVAETELEASAKTAETELEAAAKAAETELEAAAKAAETELEAAAKTAETELEAAAKTVETELEAAAKAVETEAETEK